jgi:hypothetical protein
LSGIQKWSVTGALLPALVAGFAAAPNTHAATGAKCPSGGTPSPGSTLSGGVEVDGFCDLSNVTVNGGVTVDPSFAVANAAILNDSTINGGLLVGEGSGFIAGWDINTGNLTFEHSTISGGVTLDKSGAIVVADTTVRGGFTINGSYDWPSICGADPNCFSLEPICGSEIWGNVTVRGVNTNEVFIGDPREPLFPNGDCAGNTIHGSVFVNNTNFISAHGEPTEIEANTVTGTVRLDNSTPEVNENTIGGSLLCSNGSFLRPPVAPDLPGNIVEGADSCD